MPPCLKSDAARAITLPLAGEMVALAVISLVGLNKASKHTFEMLYIILPYLSMKVSLADQYVTSLSLTSISQDTSPV